MKKRIICVGLVILSGALFSQTEKTGTFTPTPINTSKINTPGNPSAARTDRVSVAPPEIVKTNFETDYPGKANVSWKVEDDNYWVSYSDPETSLSRVIIYDKEGKIIRREDEVKEYPGQIATYYEKKHPGEAYKVWMTEKPAGQKLYFITRDNVTFWFDKDGKFVEKKREIDGISKND